jgi:hypothetical protein
MAENFAWLNPHLSLAVDWDGCRRIDITASDPDWGKKKWRACDPTSAHWYDFDRFARYMAAHIARDQDQGRRDRTVREFVAEFRGLSGSRKQKAVLDEVGASRIPLSTFFANGENRDAVARLLAACREQTKPVKPAELGCIGKDHLHCLLLAIGAEEHSVRYQKKLRTWPDGMPCVIESAFAWLPESSERHIVSGLNFSAAIRDPFVALGNQYGNSLSRILASQRAAAGESIAFFLHYVCPRMEFSDRGKAAVLL